MFSCIWEGQNWSKSAPRGVLIVAGSEGVVEWGERFGLHVRRNREERHILYHKYTEKTIEKRNVINYLVARTKRKGFLPLIKKCVHFGNCAV